MESKHQIILPKEDHVTRVIIDYYHRACGHSAREHVLASVRQKFWMTQGGSTVRSVLERCVCCRRRQAPLCQQKMADLPESRVLAEKPPFTSVGVDYFGPFQVRRGRSLVKKYGVIFTCLAIRAVHLEIAHSLSTDSFLLALRRFIARRGQVKEIYSDNGSNLTGGEKELRDAISDWIQEKYTIPCYKITSAGSSARPMVLTLEVFGRDASELLERFYKPCCESKLLMTKSGHLNVRSREDHEQPTHYHCVQ